MCGFFATADEAFALVGLLIAEVVQPAEADRLVEELGIDDERALDLRHVDRVRDAVPPTDKVVVFGRTSVDSMLSPAIALSKLSGSRRLPLKWTISDRSTVVTEP